MPQLHVYVSDELAEEIRRKAESKGVPVSRYLAALVERELAGGWPEGYFERVVGCWKGDPLARPPQGESETRDPL